MTAARGPQRRILLVEDNPLDSRATIRGLATGPNTYRIDHVGNGAEALAQLLSDAERDALPDLILLDLNLPGMSGLELLRAIKTDHRFADVPAAVLTTSMHESDVNQALEYGATRYLTKPYELDEWPALVLEVDNIFGTT